MLARRRGGAAGLLTHAHAGGCVTLLLAAPQPRLQPKAQQRPCPRAAQQALTACLTAGVSVNLPAANQRRMATPPVPCPCTSTAEMRWVLSVLAPVNSRFSRLPMEGLAATNRSVRMFCPGAVSQKKLSTVRAVSCAYLTLGPLQQRRSGLGAQAQGWRVRRGRGGQLHWQGQVICLTSTSRNIDACCPAPI